MDGPASSRYLRRALLWLVTTSAVYLLLNGAQIFETAVIVPAWTAAPPESLGMFQGKFGLDFKIFWIVFHSLHEITFIAALIVSWRLKEIRRWMLALLVIHIAVRVWTIAYFAPTIIAFQGMPYAATVDPALVERAARWRNLNIIRVLLFFALNAALLVPVYRVARMLCGGSRDSPPVASGHR